MYSFDTLDADLLATKFFIPISSHELIPRPRLSSQLARCVHYPLTLLSAPAGFGKTTLLSQWLKQVPASTAVIWLSLDETDNNLRQFWRYVFTALERRFPGSSQQALSLLQAGQPLESKQLAHLLTNAIQSEQKPCILVLDDYHVIQRSEIHEVFCLVLRHPPSCMHLVLTSRTDPPWPLARLRARGQLLELRDKQFSCTPEEATVFCEKSMNLFLAKEDMQHLFQTTEGWITGLQLFALALQQEHEPRRKLPTLHSKHRYVLDYLTEEVLRQQPEQVQAFLLHTSILKRLHPALCEAVTGQSNGQEMLEHLERANLFLVGLDSQHCWYRYHHLFARMLHSHLQRVCAPLIPSLHQRASHWYAEQGNLWEAIAHALQARDWPWAIALLERATRAISYLPALGLTTLQDWLQHFPVEVLHSNPRLCFLYAASLEYYPAQMESWLQKAEAAIQSQPATEDAGTLPQAELADLQGQIAMYRAFNARRQGLAHEALTLCEQAEGLLAPDNYSTRARIAEIRSNAYRNLCQSERAYQAALQASQLAHKAEDLAASIKYLLTAALPLFDRGQLHQIWELSCQAIELAHNLDETKLLVMCWVYDYQARTLIERYQLDEAHTILQKALRLGEQFAFAPYLIPGYALSIYLALLRGELEEARYAFQQASTWAESSGAEGQKAWQAEIEKIYFWQATSDLQSALRWETSVKTQNHQQNYDWNYAVTLGLAWLRLTQQQPGEALELLHPLLEENLCNKKWGHSIELLVPQAYAYLQQQKPELALQTLDRAIAYAEPEGYIAAFIWGGEPIAELLQQLKARQPTTTSFINTILEACEQARRRKGFSASLPDMLPTQFSQELLSSRELEVLQLLAQGASNQEIADALVLSLNTVKGYVSIILGKLGVSNRTQAVLRAHETGLLAEKL
ncbi:LuxR C-terminal-related transcriptional regulator [Ktedonosporobacter rubrisoli]|nr:LuxR C-terminal-related transcriptional regulator [Ktedonosporobacter rubrisoli]